MDKELSESVRKIAKEEDVSVNSLINRLLKKYSEWDAVEARTLEVHVTKAFVKRVMARLTDNEVRALARSSTPTALTRLQVREGQITLQGLLKTAELYGKYSGLYRLEHTSQGERHVLNFRHEICYKWSVFLSTVIKNLLGEIPDYVVEFKLNSDSCVVRLERLPNSRARTEARLALHPNARPPDA